MVDADLGVLLDDNAPKRLVNHMDPATRRARHTEFVRSVRSTRPYSIENHASSNTPEATIRHLGVLAHDAGYKCFSTLAQESETHHPGYAQHKFDSVWVIFGLQLQRAVCFKSDSHILTVIRFVVVGTNQQWTVYKQYLNTLERRWAGMNPDYAV